MSGVGVPTAMFPVRNASQAWRNTSCQAPATSPPTGSTCQTTRSTASTRSSPPGVTINVADNMWEFGTPALGAAFRRR